VRVLDLEFTLAFKTPHPAPPGFLALYRSAFGASLRKISCFTRRPDCKGCDARGRCVYSYIFETPMPPDPHPLLAKYPFAPHPFILKPRLSPEASTIHPLGITLLGRAAAHLSYVVHAFSEMGRQGIGRERRTFKIVSITERVPGAPARDLYDPKTDRLDDPKTYRLVLPRLDDPDGEPGEIGVEFVTPYRFRVEGKYSDQVDATTLSAHMTRRMTELFETHGERNERGYGVDLVRGFLERTRAIRTAGSNLAWVEIERRSARQNDRMTLGGVTGTVTFSGNVRPLLPLLLAAEHLSVGKSTSFGFGQVRLFQRDAKGIQGPAALGGETEGRSPSPSRGGAAPAPPLKGPRDP